MQAADHVAKAARIERSMDKLDPIADYETVIENCMLAGTHYLNAALHLRGVTRSTRDLLHSDKPKLRTQPPADLASVLAAMKFIEDLRPPYVRGTQTYDPRLSAECLARYRQVRDFARREISAAGRVPAAAGRR
ncbi:MAG: hypothetical protein HYU88_10575 [Chloroflexi bacterium]|nr:hypothetical protein [Chloroflexota bacterium]